MATPSMTGAAVDDLSTAADECKSEDVDAESVTSRILFGRKPSGSVPLKRKLDRSH